MAPAAPRMTNRRPSSRGRESRPAVASSHRVEHAPVLIRETVVTETDDVTASTSTLLPVAGMPMKSPVFVPVHLTRATTLSPLARTSSASMRRSGNAAMYMVKNCLTPSFVGARPAVVSCSTKSSASRSQNPSTSCALIRSYIFASVAV